MKKLKIKPFNNLNRKKTKQVKNKNNLEKNWKTYPKILGTQ